MCGIAHIRRSLTMNTDSPNGDEARVEKERKQWVKDSDDGQNNLEDVNEDGEHGDDNVEIRYTKSRQ